MHGNALLGVEVKLLKRGRKDPRGDRDRPVGEAEREDVSAAIEHVAIDVRLELVDRRPVGFVASNKDVLGADAEPHGRAGRDVVSVGVDPMSLPVDDRGRRVRVAPLRRKHVRVARERGHERRRGVAKELGRRRNLVDRAVAHHRHAVGHGGGFDRFAVADGHVTFADLIAPKEAADARYTVRWFAFDNATGRRTDELGRDTLARPSATLPAADADYLVGAFARVGHPGTTEVYVRHDEAPEVVGIRRHADGLPNTVPVWTVIPDRWRAAAPAARPEVPVSTHGTP